MKSSCIKYEKIVKSVENKEINNIILWNGKFKYGLRDLII